MTAIKSELICGLIQTNPVWQEPATNRRLFATILRENAVQHDIVIFPEMFTAGFGSDPSVFAEPADGPTFDWMQQLSAETGSALCGSYAVKSDMGITNRFVWIEPNGRHYFYDKRHLFRMMGEHKRYAMGTDRLIIEYRGWRINPQVCYDLRFPVWCRTRADTDLQIYVANWPATRALAWRTLLQARAIENQIYVIGCNRVGTDALGLAYSGDSLCCHPTGEVLHDPKDREGFFTVRLSAQSMLDFRETFPAHLDADDFVLID